MTTITGALVSMDYDRIEVFNYVDPKTQTEKPIRSFVGLMEVGDGTRHWVKISFPRDESYQPPRLQKGTRYIMPVIYGVDKKKGVVRLTMRTDIQPFEAPDL